MPKMKTKCSLKKRFRITKNGKVMSTQMGKRHNMRKRSARVKRENRGVTTLNDSAALIVKKYYNVK